MTTTVGILCGVLLICTFLIVGALKGLEGRLRDIALSLLNLDEKVRALHDEWASRQ